ncbi:hypothetical protein OC846_005592 [Tilletia horrida]|uniref:Protein kinase domain-containing protein n=1 Tax=Tilletia horrida TaxID=155126 RepID=A0AAN6GL25_9BASI|nr:hypothetical protein OC846_005592 [Tilletia horrida]KAK0562964.1 hypothetical protein OC861_005054 [Tilletia horrida]
MNDPNLSTAVPFGRVVPEKIEAHLPDRVRILNWAISWRYESFRVDIAYHGALFRFLLRKINDRADQGEPVESKSNASFCKAFWQAVMPAFGTPHNPDGWEWFRRGAEGSDGCEPSLTPDTIQQEDALLSHIQRLLPRLVSELQQQRDGPVQGSHVWVWIRDQDEHPQEPHFELVADHFRTLVFPQLHVLQDDAFPEVPRVDLSAISGYILQPDRQISFVDANLSPGSASVRMVFKTCRFSTPPMILEENPVRGVSDPKVGMALHERRRQEMLYNELTETAKVQSHPNVMPMPVALVTVTAPNRDTRLVGWLQRPYMSWETHDKIPGVEPGTPEDAHWRMRYAKDFVQAIEFLIREKGYYHSDIAAHNTLLTEPPPNGRLLLIDYERVSYYLNSDGPEAPEANERSQAGSDKSNILKVSQTGSIVQDPNVDIRIRLKDHPDALERLTIFNSGTTLARILKCRVSFPWLEPAELKKEHRIFVREFGADEADPDQKAWEALLPEALRAIVQRCCSYDPQDRPLVEDLVQALADTCQYRSNSLRS